MAWQARNISAKFSWQAKHTDAGQRTRISEFMVFSLLYRKIIANLSKNLSVQTGPFYVA